MCADTPYSADRQRNFVEMFLPLWLQQNMGDNPIWGGLATGLPDRITGLGMTKAEPCCERFDY